MIPAPPSPIVRFDPDAPVDLSPLRIGGHTVRRTRLAGTNYIRYSTMVGEDIAGRQISYPEVSDCNRHVSRFYSLTKESRRARRHARHRSARTNRRHPAHQGDGTHATCAACSSRPRW